MKKSIHCALLAGAIMSGANLTRGAEAATTTTTFTVQLTITASCVIDTATDLDFGSSGVLSAAVDATSTVEVRCTDTTPYTIGLDEGTGAGATIAARRMTNGGDTITYTLYSDAGRTTVWGETVSVDTVSGTGNGSGQSFTVYGRVPAQATPAAGVFTDTITVTVTY